MMVQNSDGVHFDVVTIFPDVFDRLANIGVVGRALQTGLIKLEVHDLRDFCDGAHRIVDDAPYGGGPGMVLKAEPFFRALDYISESQGDPDSVVLLSPQGKTLTHGLAERLSGFRHVVFFCGRYEGVDERVSGVVTEEVSIGDYVLSGGELPAAVVLDAVARQIPGVVGDRESVTADSFVRPILDFPHYTRPAVVDGHSVPDVLLSGNHEDVRLWRKREALKRTLQRRPDLLVDAELDPEEKQILCELAPEKFGSGAK
jgi:tRNA (guanine37-N1)-methyltransferase